MAASVMLAELLGVDSRKLSKEENYIIEAELLSRVCLLLERAFKDPYKSYLDLIKNDKEKECEMLDRNFVSHVIKDILQTGDYSLEGIAYYTESSEEVLTDVIAGKNPSPSFPLTRKIIDLHRSVRPTLYQEIMKKIVLDYLPESDAKAQLV